MRFTIPQSLLLSLRDVQRRRDYRDDVTESESAFLLDPGLGPALYLAADGRVLVDSRDWDGSPLREANDDEAVAAIVVGAEKTGLPELLSLLPPAPPGATTCSGCDGQRWNTQIPPHRLLCGKCWGRGWLP